MDKFMEIMRMVFIDAAKSTASTVLKLSKIVIPVIFAITLIKMTGVLEIISDVFAPVMQIFNLPGDASVPMILGAFVNIYAALSAIEMLDLSGNQVTTIAIMILIAHSLLLETAVIATIGVKRKTQLFVRISLAITVGIIVSLLLRWF